MFYNKSLKTEIVYDAFNIHEFKEYIILEKPELLYNYQYSGTQALYQLSNIDNDGVTVVGLTLYDKSPKRKTWEEFYKSLKLEGIANLYTCPKPAKVEKIYTEQEKADAAEARLLLEKAIELLPKQYLTVLSGVISDVTQDIFKCEPYGDPLYDAWKSAKNKTTKTTCHLITGSIVEYDGFACNEKAKAHYSDTNVWLLLGYGKTYECDGVKVTPEAGWFYKLKQ